MLTMPRSRRDPLLWLSLLLATFAALYTAASGATGCAQAATCLAGEDPEFTGTLTVEGTTLSSGQVMLGETNSTASTTFPALRNHSASGILALDSMASAHIRLDNNNALASGSTHLDVYNDGGGGTPFFRMDANGALFVNDTANANLTSGATFNQLSANNEILAFKATGISHGMTNLTETDTYAAFSKVHSSNGGLKLAGYSADTRGFEFYGRVNSAVTSKSTGSLGTINLIGQQKVAGLGTVGDVDANGNLVTIANNGTTRFIFDADGDIHTSGSSTIATFDRHEDVELLRSLRSCANNNRNAQVAADVSKTPLVYECAQLEELGFLSIDEDSEGGEPGEALVNLSAVSYLTMDALRQVADHYEAKLADLESRLAALEGK